MAVYRDVSYGFSSGVGIEETRVEGNPTRAS